MPQINLVATLNNAQSITSITLRNGIFLHAGTGTMMRSGNGVTNIE